MELQGQLTSAVVEEELCTNTAEDLVEPCQAKECAQQGSPIAEEVMMESENMQIAGFDMLRFKDNFFEVVEELRFRRAQDSENLKRIQELLSEKHKFIQRLDEVEKKCESLVEENNLQQLENAKKHEEEIRQYSSDQIKLNLAKESREKELKMLKDEMRVLHLANHNLEKRVQDLERQLQLQNSSRESHLNKMAQLEEKCGQLSSLAELVKDQIERLEMNVKQSQELQQRLEYVNQHQTCEITQLQNHVDSCNQELVHLRARAHDDKTAKTDNESVAKLKSTEQDLKMQTELCKHSQEELTSLRIEHQKVLQQLREAHDLLEKQMETSKKLFSKEEELKKDIDSLKVDIKKVTSDLAQCQACSESQKQEHLKELEELESELVDTKQRLKALQDDFQALQESYESLEISKKSLISQNELQIQDLNCHSKQLEAQQIELITENNTLKERSQDTLKQIESCHSALEQSESEIARLRSTISERDRLITELEEKKVTFTVNQHGCAHEAMGGQSDVKMSDLAPTNLTEGRIPSGMPSASDRESTEQIVLKEECRCTIDQCQPPPAEEKLLEEPEEAEVQATPHKKLKLESYNDQANSTVKGNIDPSAEDIESSNESNTFSNKNISPNVIEVEDSPLVPRCEESFSKNEENEASKKMSEDCLHDEKQVLLMKESFIGGSLASPVTKKIEEGTKFDFSPDEHSGLMSTQMNRQIERVEKFLRMDRLRRKRDPLTFQID